MHFPGFTGSWPEQVWPALICCAALCHAQAVALAGGNKPVLVTLTNCNMTRQVAVLRDEAR